jgi:electron transfer flavoprotein alpha subunit
MRALLFATGAALDRTIRELSSAASITSNEHYLFTYSEACRDKLKLKAPFSIRKGWCAEKTNPPPVLELKASLKDIIESMGIRYVFLDDSPLSFWVAPLLAGELRAAFISDVVWARREKGNVVLSKPLQEERILGDYALQAELLVAIVRKGFPAVSTDFVEVELEKMNIERKSKGELEYLGARERVTSRLEKAEIVVGLGDGVVQSGSLDLSLELAKALGAEHAVTKPLVEKQVAPRERMVGVSGKRISPRAYIALGVSGSMYHLSGVLSAETIISVNKDDGALINAFSDYYYVGDLREVLPKLLEHLRKKSP